MGRGLGHTQLRIMDQLEGSTWWVPLWELVDDPGDPTEMSRARSAVRGLERRGLVATVRMPDEDRRVPTNVVVVDFGAGFESTYRAEESTRAWSGMHVRLTGSADAHMAQWAAKAAADLEAL